jgi:ketosteroid isomerase-like protein
VYHQLVRRIARRQFGRINRHDIDGLVEPWTDQTANTMIGRHALSGTRHSIESGRRWFERLFRLFPDLRFEVKEVMAAGWPWSTTTVAVEWVERATTPTGEPYENKGVHVIRIEKGKVVSTTIYLDTQKLAATLDRMAEQGVEEAAAAPIES